MDEISRKACDPIVTKEVTITMLSGTPPIIPCIRVPYTPSPDAPNRQRLVTFKTEGGTATVIIPVEGTVTSAIPLPNLGVPGCTTFKVDDQHIATVEIKVENTQDIEIEYQILCNDHGTLYWAKGDSPPRMQIPPV